MYVCTYVCMHVRTYVRTFVRMCVHACMHTCVPHVCAYVRAYALHAYVRMCVCICAYAHMYVCLFVRTCVRAKHALCMYARCSAIVGRAQQIRFHEHVGPNCRCLQGSSLSATGAAKMLKVALSRWLHRSTAMHCTRWCHFESGCIASGGHGHH